MTASLCLASLAISNEGCSRKRPLRIMISAAERVFAIDGAGSYVCELVPSGIMPSSCIFWPPMFSARLVIGETVVTTCKRSGLRGICSELVAWVQAPAIVMSPKATMMRRVGNMVDGVLVYDTVRPLLYC